MLASSGKEALSVLSKSNGADLVITDMQMPCMDGVMLAERIRELYPGIPLILLSSIGEDVKKEKPGLFASVMNKPIKHHILSKQILNALQRHNGAHPEAVASKVLSADFSDAYPCNILVAEDNPMNQHVITHILKKLGYQPEIAKNGQEAVEAANLKDYTLILMDMQMPVMDGLEATRAIRKTLVEQPVIIALTANTMSGDEAACLNAGMDDYLAKPIKIEELTGKIKKWVLLKSNRNIPVAGV